jgi:apolipoprotein D and lipocalin family protein
VTPKAQSSKTFARSTLLPAGLALVGASLLLAGCAAMQRGPVGNQAVPQPAKAVELDRYLGRWYEHGRYKAGFQKGCEAVTAEYSLRSDGMVGVLNSCHKGAVDGKLSTAEGKAKIVENSRGAKLKVSFFGPFYGDYWVLDHADDYSWSIVGEPSGRYLWMLTRTPNPDDRTAALLKARVQELGYDWSLVRMTKH